MPFGARGVYVGDYVDGLRGDVMKFNVDDLTVKQVREIAGIASGIGGGSCVSGEAHPYLIGENVFIRTVTHHYTGKLVAVYSQELVIEDAAWIADDGVFSVCLETCNPSEVEPFPDGKVIIGRGTVLDVSLWAKALPRVKK